MGQVTALILAAGEGKRMKSDKAKAVHRVFGKAMVEWVYEAAREAGVDRFVVVVGHNAQQVIDCMGDKAEYVLQQQRLGTGHAVLQAYRYYSEDDGYTLVLYGDTPLISADTIKNAISYLKNSDYKAVVITAEVKDPTGYGRIIRDGSGNFVKIVEHRDATEDERTISEINSGMYVFMSKELAEAIKLLDNNNGQKEYYLTDTLEIMLSKGCGVGVYKAADGDEVLGVNDVLQLRQVSALLERKMTKKEQKNESAR